MFFRSERRLPAMLCHGRIKAWGRLVISVILLGFFIFSNNKISGLLTRKQTELKYLLGYQKIKLRRRLILNEIIVFNFSWLIRYGWYFYTKQTVYRS